MLLTAVDFLVNGDLLAALVALRDGLGLELRAVDVAVGVHGLLESVALPAEHVVTVISISGRVTEGPDEGLAAVGRPVVGVVERACVPDDLVKELGDLDRMGRGAGTAALEGTTGVRDVARVVG